MLLKKSKANIEIASNLFAGGIQFYNSIAHKNDSPRHVPLPIDEIQRIEK